MITFAHSISSGGFSRHAAALGRSCFEQQADVSAALRQTQAREAATTSLGTDELSARISSARAPQLAIAGVLFLLAATLHAAPLRVIDETAIPFAAFLSKADFDQRYPGEMVDDPSQLETGWYVIYEHESLNYYFGPMLLESTGEDYLGQLTETVEAAVAQRPSIRDYRLELSYEPSVSSSDAGAQPPGEPAIPNPLPPQPEPRPSFWGFIKRIFGFG